jgi:phosphoglycerate dehydrogenase-like enzyme
MKALKIFSDTLLSDSALKLLQTGVAPHELVFPARPAQSVLGKSDLDPALDGVDIAFGQPDIASVLHSSRLRWVHLTTAGYTRYDTAEFRAAVKARGLLVTNSSTVYAEPCAEHVFAFLLAQGRRLPVALRTSCSHSSPVWSELRNSCALLREQSVVILGFGAIALKLVEMLRPFRIKMVALRRKPRGDEVIPIITHEQLPQALAVADHVINILPDNADSTRFINAERLAGMKPGAIFYNIGRGTTVDQTALLHALQSGHLGAAWLDVTDPEPLPADHPLRTAPNCFITPHTAGGQRNEAEALVRHFLNNLGRFINGSPLTDRIM